MEAQSPPPAVEVSHEQAHAEDVDQVAPRQRPGREKDQHLEEAKELLAPKRQAKEWNIGKGNDGEPIRTYVQRELSVITKVQWFELVGEFLEKTLGEISLNTLMSPPDSVRQAMASGDQNVVLRASDFQDADTFVQAIGKILIRSRDFLSKSVCIWLQIPDHEWEMAINLMRMSPDLGGLSDAAFFEMIEIFIDQNYKDIRENFRERLQSLRDRWRAREEELNQSR